MNNLLTKYHASLSWLIVALAALFLALLLAGPLLDQHEKYRFELLRDGSTLQRLQALTNSRTEIENAEQAFNQRGLGEWLYSPQMASSAVELAIQRRVSDVFSSTGAQVRSIAPISSSNKDGYTVVGVTAQFSGELDVVISSLQALEGSNPLLFLENLTLAPTAARRTRNNEPSPQLLNAQVSVIAYLPVIREEQ